RSKLAVHAAIPENEAFRSRNGPTCWERRSSAAWRPRARLAGGPNVPDGCRDRSSDRASLRAGRIPTPPCAPVLVSVIRDCDGHGLAFVRYHHIGDRRSQARPVTPIGGTWSLCLRRAGPALFEDAR